MADDVKQESGLDSLSAKATPKAAPVNENVLAQMEELYKQKQEQKKSLMETLADATAWWSGGVAGPGEALARRAQTKSEQDKELQALGMDIASKRIALQNAKNALGSITGLSGIPASTAGTPTAGTPTAGTPTAGTPTAGVTTLPPGMGTYKGITLPTSVLTLIRAHLAGPGGEAEADKEAQKYINEENKAKLTWENTAATYDQKPYWNEELGKTERLTPAQVRGRLNAGTTLLNPVTKTKITESDIPGITGIRNNNPGNIKFGDFAKSQGATGQDERGFAIFPDIKSGENAQHSLLSGEKYGKLPIKDIASIWAPKGDGQNDPLSYTKAIQDITGFSDKTMSKTYSQLTPIQQNLIRVAQRQIEHGPSGVQMPTSIKAPSTVPGKRYETPEEEEAAKAALKESATSQSKEIGTATGKRAAALEDIRPHVGSQIANSRQMLNILEETPEAVGLKFRNKTTGALMTAAEAGLIPLLGKKDLEEVVASQLSDKARVNRDMFDSLATANALEFRRAAMKGTGQVSDFESKLTNKASGLDKTHSPEANYYFAVIGSENLRTQDKLLKEWDKYKDTHGDTADFSKFERSAEYKALQKEKEERLKKHFPVLAAEESGFGEKPKGPTVEQHKKWDTKYGTKKD